MQIWIEPDQTAAIQARVKKVSAKDAAVDLAQGGGTISETVKAYCANLVKGIKELPAGIIPKSIEAELGIKLSVEATIFVAKTSGKGSLKVKAAWQLG
jgi:hypothetical protein